MNRDLSPCDDYPAAHSMDTTWFAVDRDGFVAVFESNEGGVVPEGALSTETTDLVEELGGDVQSEPIYTVECEQTPLSQGESHVPPTPVRRRPPFQFPPASASESGNVITRLWRQLSGQSSQGAEPPATTPAEPEEDMLHGAILVLVRDMGAVQEYVDRGACRVLRTNGPLAVLFPRMSMAVHRDLHERSICLGCYHDYRFEEMPEYQTTQPSAVGLYFYECCEGQAAYPYGRRSLPSAPLHIDDMPQELRAGLMQVQFGDLSFAETAYLQPAEKVKSYSWDGGYLASDWKTYRANPGQEAEYREIYQEMSEYGEDGIVYEPPPDPA
jgi:hypothetical protein